MCCCAVVSPAAAAPLAEIAVEAGKVERIDVPVSAALPKGLAAAGGVRLVETTGGKAVEVPCQIAPGEPRRLWWVLAGKTPAGAKRTFQLVAGKPRTAARRVEARKGDEAIELVVIGAGGQEVGKVLRYYHAPLAPPKGVAAKFARSAFIHPAWSPAGSVLTCNFPRDHYHHKGIWNPPVKASFRGKNIDFWNLGSGKATVRFKAYGPIVSGPVFAGFVAHHEYVVSPGKPDEAVAIRETWRVRAWNVGGPKEGYWLWDVGFDQQAAAGEPVTIRKYHYGGMAFRGAASWFGPTAYALTSEGKSRKGGHGSRARWCALGGVTDGKPAGGILMTHPSNFRFPEPMRVWPAGMKGVFVSFTPAQLGDWKIEPGGSYAWQYRFCGYDGKINAALANRLWADFGQPPAVTLRPVAK